MCTRVSRPLLQCHANWKQLRFLHGLLTAGQRKTPSTARLFHSSHCRKTDGVTENTNGDDRDGGKGGDQSDAIGILSSPKPPSSLPSLQASPQFGTSQRISSVEEPPSLHRGSSNDEDVRIEADPSQNPPEGVKPKIREPPVPPDPETCCETGCVNCVWIKYAEEVKEYYPDHQERFKEVVDMIEDYNVKTFVKMELGIK